MISLDTNILFFSINQDAPSHERAATFVRGIATRSDIVISELTLIELYRLLRDSLALPSILEAHWIPEVGLATIHDALWNIAARPGIAYRRIYDIRLALTLQHFGHGLRHRQHKGFRRSRLPPRLESACGFKVGCGNSTHSVQEGT